MTRWEWIPFKPIIGSRVWFEWDRFPPNQLAVFLFVHQVPTTSQLIFLMEPPPRLSFSNSTGARVLCAAHGNPPPAITWLTEDGVPVSDIPGLR
ncbi:unnamed protein product [Leptosia nina]|uniref:Ig-like domain-containing protein n=1 Tax=Leptosia nina TaxID=320188 RepID=A0AAV1IUX3_9NEOP